MKNDKKIIYGKFDFQGREYPFIFTDSCIFIVQTPDEFNRDFIGVQNIEKLDGLTSKNQHIVFYGCKLIGGEGYAINSSLEFSVKGYFLYDTSQDEYNQIRITTEALNAFYSPLKAIDVTKLREVPTKYEIKSKEEIRNNFEMVLGHENVFCEIGIYIEFNLQYRNSEIGNKDTYLDLRFSTMKSSEDSIPYILMLHDFLSFVSFRKYITFNRVYLYNSDENSCKKVGEAFLNLKGNEYDFEKTILFDDIGKVTMKNLLTMFYEKRESSNNTSLYLPENDKEYGRVDNVLWMKTAMCFEGEFCQRYKGLKYDTQPQFRNSKDRLIDFIDKEIESSGVSKNNERNKYYISFRNLIEMSDTTIREKFQFMLNRYNKAVSGVIEKYSNRFHLAKFDIPQMYATYRNQLAHGTITAVTNENLLTFELLRAFIYLMLLEDAGVVDSTRQRTIVDKLF